jgi:hypothetical protein
LFFERLAMRGNRQARLDVETGHFEKRHGRKKRTLASGRTEYERKDEPRVKKINPWDVAELLDGDIDAPRQGMRIQDDQDEQLSKAS